MFRREIIFLGTASALTFGVVLNDASASPGSNPYFSSVHQLSILLILFSAFQVGAASMFDILWKRGDRKGLGTAAFVYSSLMWCFVNIFWALGFYAFDPLFHGSDYGDVLAGFDTPFTLGFYAPHVPRLVMVGYAAMNLVAFSVLWKRRTKLMAVFAIAVPIVFVNAYAIMFGSITLSI